MIDSKTLDSPEKLKQAFEVFSELSQTLTRSYTELEGQVARLNAELAAARSARLQTLVEKEQLASKLQRLLEILPGGVVVLDGQGRVIECNPAAVQLLGEPLLGELWCEVTERSFTACLDNPHERRLRNGQIVSLSARRLEDEAGQILLLADVSEMRALQDLVDQHRRLSAMGEMVASMAHQVRTPLAAAILYASQLDNPELDPARRGRFVEKILGRLHHLERQVNDMLIFAREGRFVTGRIEIPEFLKQLKNAAEPHFSAAETRLRFSCIPPQGAIQGNAEALLGAFLNLLNNALEALQGQGRIEVRAEIEGDQLCISVIDDGPGMEDEIRARIFEPFFTTRANGTGLGLAVVNGIVKAHGGSVQCHSAPGGGAVFRVCLPLVVEDSPLPGGYRESLKNLDFSKEIA